MKHQAVEYRKGRCMKRAFVIVVVVDLFFVLALLHSAIKDFLWAHPWWHSFLVAVPAIALPVLAYFELRHSGEANTLRSEANNLRRQIGSLTAELDAERNRHLGQIARNIEKPATQADRNANTLRKHLRAKVAVSEGEGSWGSAPEIVEVSDENIVTLFMPRDYSSPRAWCVRVHCGELEITEIPQGSCPLRLKILKRYGPRMVEFGEITNWEDRLQPAANPTFAKGGAACHASYSKPGSPERLDLYVHASGDGANSFLLEASTGQKVLGDNKEISKRFMAMQVDYEAEGFARTQFGTGGSPHPLFVR
ncbi:MAG: hypothetical protein WBD87_00445 [Candidatus Acidiferrales bacterium]